MGSWGDIFVRVAGSVLFTIVLVLCGVPYAWLIGSLSASLFIELWEIQFLLKEVAKR